MAATRVGPLNAAVPIVDRFGRPTPEFMAKWLEQNRVNAAIPDVSDAAALSALLDMFGGTQGALLIRGSQRWEELPSPGGTKKFLRADGTYADVTEDELTLSDVDTNDVSTLRHGFAPKLPNDATKYLDGTGQWSTPAGGGGGGGGWFGGASGTFASGSGASYATRGIVIKPDVDVQVTHLMAWIRAANATTTLHALSLARLAYVNFSSGTQIVSGSRVDEVLGTTASVAMGSTNLTRARLALANPVTLTAGVYYAVCASRTDGTGTNPCNVGFVSYGINTAWAVNFPGDTYVGVLQFDTTSLSANQTPNALVDGWGCISIEGFIA